MRETRTDSKGAAAAHMVGVSALVALVGLGASAISIGTGNHVLKFLFLGTMLVVFLAPVVESWISLGFRQAFTPSYRFSDFVLVGLLNPAKYLRSARSLGWGNTANTIFITANLVAGVLLYVAFRASR